MGYNKLMIHRFFAHNGVDHSTASEAVAHSASDIFVKAFLITVAVVLAMGVAVWATGRLSKQTVKVKDKED